jgi:hypothetical protein
LHSPPLREMAAQEHSERGSLALSAQENRVMLWEMLQANSGAVMAMRPLREEIQLVLANRLSV